MELPPFPIISADTGLPLVDAGACWECDDSVFVERHQLTRAAEYQMLFCSKACEEASRRKGTHYGIGLTVILNPSTL